MKRKWLAIGVGILLVFSIVVGTIGCDSDTTSNGATPSEAAPSEAAPTQAPKEFQIGIITGLTGPAAAIFAGHKECWDMAAAEANEAGGITVNGQKYLVELVYYDDKFTVEGVTAAIQKLKADGVKIFIGPAVFPDAVSKIAHEAGLLHFDFSGSYGIYGDYGQLTFCIHVGGTAVNLATVVYAAENYPDVVNFGMMGQNNVVGRSTADNIINLNDTVLGDRFEIIPATFYEPGTTDFRPLLISLLQEDPDIINVLQAPTDEVLLMIKQARELGYTGKFQTLYAFTPEEIEAVMPAEYIYGIQIGGMTYWENPPDILADYKDRFIDRYGHLPGANVAYEISQIPDILRAIEEAHSFDTLKIAQVLESWPSWEAHHGTFSWGGLETTGWNHIAEGPSSLTLIDSADNWYTVIQPAVQVP